MANQGVPAAGSYPSRAEIQASLGGYVEDIRGVGANLRRQKYDELNAFFQDAAQDYNPQATQAPPAPAGAASNEAVKLNQVPTSSTNPSRPRTVAAGYDPKTKTMTVVFRDGTFYNYYEVTPGEWLNFSTSYSKGKPWLNKGFANGRQAYDGLFISKPHGVADAGQIDPAVREQLYRVARSQQLYRKPRPAKTGAYTDPYGYNQRRVSGWEKKVAKPFKRRTGYTAPRTQSGQTRTGL